MGGETIGGGDRANPGPLNWSRGPPVGPFPAAHEGCQLVLVTGLSKP